MAKDPAFLFYPGDWQGGTMTMSRFLKGCYLDLLVAQFNSGPLSLEEIRTVLGSDFGQAWPSLQKKFKTANGLFFNERLEAEKAKRTAYSQSRSKNRKKSYDTTHEQSYDLHMESENRNENAIESKNVRCPMSDVDEVSPNEHPTSDIRQEVEQNLLSWFKEPYFKRLEKEDAYPGIDIRQQFKQFSLKVRDAADRYVNHDMSGLRQAFNFQLRTAKPTLKNGDTNGKIKRDKLASATSFGNL